MIHLIYHHEDSVWWVESPDMPGYVVSENSFKEAQRLAHEGIKIFEAESNTGDSDTRDTSIPKIDERLDNNTPIVTNSTIVYKPPFNDKVQHFFTPKAPSGRVLYKEPEVRRKELQPLH